MRTKHGLGLLMAVLLAAPAPQAAQTPEAMLGAALHQERVTGNMQAAIDGYRKLLASKGVSRSLAAQAQFHIGICYEKLGNQEARKAFENVVRNYSDQKDLATQARARLAAMGGGTSLSDGMSLRRIDTGGRFSVTGGISSDGRLIAFTDYVKGGSPAVYDTVTKQEKRLTDFDWDAPRGFGDENAVSRDGKWVAFHYYRMGGRDPEMRVVGTENGGPIKNTGARPVYRCSDGRYIFASPIADRWPAF